MQETTEKVASTELSQSYLSSLDDFIDGAFSDRNLRPWSRGRYDLAYLVKAIHGISQVYDVPRHQVWKDLQEKIQRVESSLSWKLRSVLGRAYVLLQYAGFYATHQAYGRMWPRKYVPGLNEDWLDEFQGWRSKVCVDAPLASIVVVSHNRAIYLRTTLCSLFQTVDPGDVEIIVVDNGSSDGSREFVQDLADRELIDKAILCQANHGIAKGFNLGFAHANPNSRNLVKLDSDIVILSPNWLHGLHQFLQSADDVGAACMVELNHYCMTHLPRKMMGGEEVSSWNWGVCSGAGTTIPREVFNRVGYFREEFDFTYSPCDFDMPLRMALLGYENFYVQQYSAFHRTDLDHSLYRTGEKRKKRQKLDRANARQRLTGGYASGEIDPVVFYPKYENCRVDGRVLEID